MSCLEVNGLSHQFDKDNRILDNINMTIETGSIYGFLGPNGAGKTTTLKLILGLLKKQHGNITIFGKSLDTHRLEILKKVGSLIETPSIYSHLTAVENLRIWQKVYQAPTQRIQEVLTFVGLNDTRSKKSGQFSLGMKQRLGIAIALLHNPALLILDEPTNGLDPNGMIEMRELLKNLSQQHGITILISSHLLAEIEKLVIHVGIIHHGTMRFEGTLNALMNQQKAVTKLSLRTNKNDVVFSLLSKHEPCWGFNNRIDIAVASEMEVAEILRFLMGQNIDIYEAQTLHADLETNFMHLIK